MIRILWQKIKQGMAFLVDDSYLENVFADLLIVLTPLFGQGGLPKSFFLCTVLWVIKIFRFKRARKFYTYTLLREAKGNGSFILLALGNVGFTFLILYYFGFVESETTWFMAIIYRIYLLYEDSKIQNILLERVIEETVVLGEVNNPPSPLSSKNTLRSLESLSRIKESYREALKEKMRTEKMKTELITNISHDLKTPLTSIINYADILSKKESMDEEAKNYIRILGRNSDRLKSLIIDLIDASKTGTGNVHIEKGFIEFNELVLQIYGDFDAAFNSKNLEFVYEGTDEDILLYSDGNLLSRVIQNLIANVGKYAQQNTRVYARAQVTDTTLYFSIKNVSARKLNMTAEELMEQFIRGEKSRNTDGSGLGLYIAKNLVELLGGKCRIVIDGDYFQVFLEIPKEG